MILAHFMNGPKRGVTIEMYQPLALVRFPVVNIPALSVYEDDLYALDLQVIEYELGGYRQQSGDAFYFYKGGR